jgi:hypothetical protein
MARRSVTFRQNEAKAMAGSETCGAAVAKAHAVSTGVKATVGSEACGAVGSEASVISTGGKATAGSETCGAAGSEASAVSTGVKATAGLETCAVSKVTEDLPKKLIVHAPALATGSYTLKIVTRYSNAKVLVQEPRAITYTLPLTVATE